MKDTGKWVFEVRDLAKKRFYVMALKKKVIRCLRARKLD